jgi:hypothetical protein
MKKSVFKYFDTFCYGELIPDEEDSNWAKPSIEYNAFGYSINENHLFYNGGLLDNVAGMFNVGRADFKEYLGEWFQDRYNLPVRVVL